MNQTVTKGKLSTGTKKPLLRHILLMVEGKPSDECLCGYVWDRFPLKNDPDASICEECLEIARGMQ